jgi:G3E family GTPase
MPASPVDLILLTGFLGAGKTTLVNRLVERLNGAPGEGPAAAAGERSRRPPVGVLINDFGRVVVDGELVRSHGAADELELFEVADGSIFCSCKTASFVAGLRMFARLRPRTLIVEASGMSDPSGLSKILRDNRLQDDFVVRRIVCLVDPTRFPKLYGTLTAVERQVAGADLVLINKADVVPPAELDALEATVAEINPTAAIRRTTYADIDPSLVTAEGSRELMGDVVSCSTPETRPAALQFEPDALPRPELERFLAAAAELSYRIKGWVHVDGEWFFVSDNDSSVEFRPAAESHAAGAGFTVICAPEHAAHIAELWRGAASARQR